MTADAHISALALRGDPDAILSQWRSDRRRGANELTTARIEELVRSGHQDAFFELYAWALDHDPWHWVCWEVAWFVRKQVMEDVRHWWWFNILLPLKFAFGLGSFEPWIWQYRREGIAKARMQMALELAKGAAMLLGDVDDDGAVIPPDPVRGLLHLTAALKFAAIR